MHQLLMMKNLDDYMLFTKDSVATDTLANIGLSSGTIEKNYNTSLSLLHIGLMIFRDIDYACPALVILVLIGW